MTGPPDFQWNVHNLGPHGVFDAVCEGWMWSGERFYDVNKPDWIGHDEAVGASKLAVISTEFSGVAASRSNHYLTWRVRWSDRYGNRWVANGRDRLHDAPHKYRADEKPPQHQGPSGH